MFCGIRLVHKEWRKLIKKMRRKKKRQKIARERNEKEVKELEDLMVDPSYILYLEDLDKLYEEERRLEEEEAARKHDEWFARDVELHALWCSHQKEKKKQELRLKEQESLIQKEWTEKVEEQKEKTDPKRMLLQAAHQVLVEGEVTQNPEPPTGFGSFTVEFRPREVCQFFTKTGACIFGVQCSREHLYPEVSCTILFPNMYSHFGLDQAFFDEYDSDSVLEYEDKETYQHFRDFYYDILEEFRHYGNVVQLKVCCNRRPHLRGNVYVQYSKNEMAAKALAIFNGRWYAGKQLNCTFVSIEKWKSAICALYWRKKCPKGDDCNFLHVFRNPDSEFNLADKDIFQREDVISPLRRLDRGSSPKTRSWLDDARWGDVKSCRKRRESPPRRRPSSRESKSASRHQICSPSKSRSRSPVNKSRSSRCERRSYRHDGSFNRRSGLSEDGHRSYRKCYKSKSRNSSC